MFGDLMQRLPVLRKLRRGGIGADNRILRALQSADDGVDWATISTLLDATVGSSRGTLAVRGASGWSALAPPTVVGYVPVWNGTDPVWGPAESTGNAFSWTDLFTSYAATAGGAYEFTDISTLFKDTAGTTPVTTTGDAIARVNDKSGLGHNFTQATAGNRPLYFVDQQGYGSAHFVSATPCWMDGSGLNCDQVTCWQAYVSKSAAGGRILDTRGTGASGTVKGWYMAAGDGGGTNLFQVDDGAGNYLFDDPATFLANNISVTVAQYVKGNATIFSKVFMKGGDGTVYAGTNALKGITPGNVTSAATCRMGAPSNSTASQTLNGYLYACGSIGAVLNATDRDRVVTHLRNIATSI